VQPTRTPQGVYDRNTAAIKKVMAAIRAAAGAQVGCVLNIDENGWSYYGSLWSGRYQPQTQNVMQNAPGSDQPPSDDGPISLGQIAVQAEVQVRFGLK
jgi:uncharacterized protein YggE